MAFEVLERGAIGKCNSLVSDSLHYDYNCLDRGGIKDQLRAWVGITSSQLSRGMTLGKLQLLITPPFQGYED